MQLRFSTMAAQSAKRVSFKFARHETAGRD